MAFDIHVFLINSSFSEEYAQEKHDGADSAENTRYEWEDEFRLKAAIQNVSVKRNSNYMLQGEKGDGTLFSHEIPDVMIFEFSTIEGIIPVVVSEKAIEEYMLDTETNQLSVYLNDIEVIENPIPGVYIALSDFPKELAG